MPEDTIGRVALSIGSFALGFFTVKFSTFSLLAECHCESAIVV
jgi:hypothetical protein